MTKDPMTNAGTVCARRINPSAVAFGHSSFVLRHSPGYTLLEMLLALAVVAAVAAMAWPVVTRIYADRQLREGAERARVLAASARLRAIDAGLIYQFRYEPGGGRYLIAPYEPVVTADGMAADAAAGPTETAPRAESGELPEGVTFAATGGESFMGERLDPALIAALPDALQLGQASWSAPLLFFPDGTAEDTTFEIIDDRQQSIVLTVRGLTGTVSLAPVTREASRW